MKAARPRAVVFDLDGTLLDSLPLVLQAFAHALQPFTESPTMEIFARLGGPPARVFSNLLGGDTHVPAALERLTLFNRDNGHRIRPFEGVARWLGELRGKALELAVWTGRDRGTTLTLLREHGLEDFFSHVICGDDLPTHKPDPQGLNAILERLGVPPKEALLIGDADVDVHGGAACGVDTVLIRNGRAIEADVEALAWRIVSSPSEAFEVVLDRIAAHGDTDDG